MGSSVVVSSVVVSSAVVSSVVVSSVVVSSVVVSSAVVSSAVLVAGPVSFWSSFPAQPASNSVIMRTAGTHIHHRSNLRPIMFHLLKLVKQP